MAATAEDVQGWIDEAKARNKVQKKRKKPRIITHIISMCDTFDWSDYPVMVYSDQTVEMIKRNMMEKPMQRINEVIEIT